MDEATRSHLFAWIKHNIRDEEQAEMFSAMISVYLDDPDYWGAQGWSRVRDVALERS